VQPLSTGTLTRSYNSYFDVTNVSDTGTGVQSVPGVIPFVSVSADNFTLTEDTAAWTPLGSPYNMDLLGNTRASSRGALQFPGIYSPVNGSTLAGSSATLQWAGYSGATAYWLDIGSTQGGNNYYSSGSLSNSTLSLSVSTLPSNGSTVYATWYYLLNGTWTPNYYSYTALGGGSSQGVITSPVPSSTLSGSSVTFSWTAGAGASAYWLDVGNTAGGNNYYSSGNLGNVLTQTVNGLPTNGSAVYVTLYSFVGGAWLSNAYNYTAFNGSGAGLITSPANGLTLSGSSVTFNWTAGPGASAYWLDVGSTAGGNNYYSSGNLGNVLTQTVNGLPTNGSAVYVTLYSLISGVWSGSAYTYTAFTAVSGAGVITSPANGSTLSGSSVAFNWAAGAGASAYWLDVGNTAGGNNYYSSGNLGNVLSQTVSSLPTNGSAVYVTLYSLIGGVWSGNAYVYTAFIAASGPGVITAPANGSTLCGSSVAFHWTAGAGASAYWLDVGGTAGGNNYYSSGNVGNVLSQTVTGLPTNGSAVYVTLYSLISGVWSGNAYTYTAFTAVSGAGVITAPANGSTLSGSSVTFDWTAGAGASAYWLDVGGTAGGNNYYSSGNLGNVLSQTVTGLPTNGSAVYVTLYSLISGVWSGNAYAYTAFTAVSGAGVITAPANGSTLSGSSVAFNWTAGPGATAYWIDVGSTSGGNDYYSSGNLGNVLSQTVNGLPTNGSAVYVTLYSSVGGVWLSNAYVYTAFTAASEAGVITSPANGSTLGGSSVAFNWTAGSDATAYWIDVGSTSGGNNYYSSGNLGNVLTTTVSGLPTDGSTIYATLYSLISGVWSGNPYTYTAVSATGGLAALTSPVPGTTLSGTTLTFTWSSDSSATAYWMDIGSTAGGNDVYSSGNVGTATTTTVSTLPANGNTIYVSLYSNVGGQWLNNPVTYISGP